MATATHGSISEFRPGGKETWSSYTERLGYYFAANGVTTAAQKRAILLAVCGPATLKLIKSLADPDTFDAQTYEQLCTLVKDYYEPARSEIVQRFNFNTRYRANGETVAAYVAALRELATQCNYGAKLSEMLRDRLVCGINHDGIQKRLLSEKELSYETAYSIAVAIEASERDAKHLKSGGLPAAQVFFNRKGKTPPPPTSSRDSDSRRTISCFRCGGNHLAPVCHHKDKICSYCKKRGHLVRVCQAKKKAPGDFKPPQGDSKPQQPQKNMYIEEEATSECSYDMFTIRDQSNEPTRLKVSLNDCPVEMIMDTGAAVSIISQATFDRIRKQRPTVSLTSSAARLQTYTGELIPVVGATQLSVRYETNVANLSVQVVAGEGPDLMGRDWLASLKVNTCGPQVNLVEHDKLQEVLDKHKSLFDGTLGCMKDVKVDIQVDKKVKPKFLKPRTLPYMAREKTEKELDKLEKLGIISPVHHSEWAAPIVAVTKRDGNVRICGDFSTTVNQASLNDTYPLPRIEDLFANLSGGKFFSKLDLKDAYYQLPVSDESKKYLTINTHKGLYQYNRLPFGVTSAPSVFQRTMDSLLRGLKGSAAFIDDILVTGSTLEEHLQNLDAVLTRLEEAGVRLKAEKCFFLKSRIEYLGHVIDATGLHPTDDKIIALREAPTPNNVTQLRSFLGIVNYYGKFLPNLSTTLSPLYNLLRKNKKWSWSREHDSAFKLAKEALQSDAVLVHYDCNKPLVLACDASEYGLGAVLSHVMESGQERPIAYISRTLNPAERRYSQLEREGLAIVYAVKKFHNYLYGRHFTIESDHQPLSYLFSETKGIPAMASSRIQRWALTLAAYQYNIRYKSGKTLTNADALSRLPRPITTSHDGLPGDLVHLVQHLSSTSISAGSIKLWTAKDPTMSRVVKYLQTGWPQQTLEEEFKPFISRKKELSLLDGCILWGSRIVIPPQGRKLALQELHETHPGCTKMKGLARSYIWWPKMDSAIEDAVRQCQTCQESRPSPAAAPLHPWEWPSQPWSRIHLDFAGPFLGSMHLIIVDAHSKWMDIHPMQSITSTKTIEKLRIVFANHGLPQKVVTDNGPSFTSAEFAEFMKGNGILHIKSAPYHPSTNGLAERAVQTFKQGVAKITGSTVQERISKFLFSYRITPHSVTGVPPSELLYGRRLRCKLDTWYPDISQRVQSQQQKQKQAHDSTIPKRSFSVGDLVFAENFTGTPPKWLPGAVVMVTGPLSYQVELESGNIVRRHVDSVRKRHVSEDSATGNEDNTTDHVFFPATPPTAPPNQNNPPPPPPVPQLPRRSSRPHKPVRDRLGY